MKKTLSIVLSLIMIISTMAIAPFTALADGGDGVCGDVNWNYSSSDKRLSIYGEGKMKDMLISPTPWDDVKDEIEVVCIHEGVTTIGDNAFFKCKNLKEVEIASTVTRIGVQSFASCYSLEKLVIPSTVTQIAFAAFYDTTYTVYYNGPAREAEEGDWMAKELIRADIAGDNILAYLDGTTLTLKGTGSTYDWSSDWGSVAPWPVNGITKVVIGNGITRIGNEAFYGMSSIEEVVMADSVKEIGDGAFFNAKSLNKITLSKNLESIGAGAFIKTAITEIKFPSTLKSLGVDAFAYCWMLESVQLNNGLKEIGEYAFYSAGLKSIVIPSTVETIGDSAFDDCESLESVQLNNGLKHIGEYAFYYTNLKSVVIPSTVETIGESAFDDCEFLETVELNNGLKSIGPSVFARTNIKTIVVPCSVTKIDGFAFLGIDTVYYSGSAKDSYKENWGAKQVLPNTTTKGHKTTTAVTKATTSKNGSKVTKCSNCGQVISKSTIYYPKTITLSTTKYTYDGNAKKPTVTVKDSKGNKISSSNYTVTYSNNKLVGKATVKVTFKGNYSGTVSKSFTIVPKTTSISSLTALSKGFTVKWKKQATQTTGYQIQIATDSGFTKGVKSYTVSSPSTVSKKITKLTGKKKYYVRIRTYKTVSGTKYYSSWSASKTVTTKK